MGKSWVSWQYLLQLSQFKVCGLEEPAGAVFINPARCMYACKYVWMDGWMDGWVDEWMGGWM